jgi:hypothetical protein
MPNELTREERLTAAINGTDAILETLAEMADSFDPDIVSEAKVQLIRARNLADDLRANRAFRHTDGALQPITEEQAAALDALGRELDASTRSAALANAGLSFLATAIETASRIGQILDERATAPVRTMTA